MGLNWGRLNVEWPPSMPAERGDEIAILCLLPALLERRAAKVTRPGV